ENLFDTATERDRVLEVVEHRDRRHDVEEAIREPHEELLRREEALDDRRSRPDSLGHVGGIDPELRGLGRVEAEKRAVVAPDIENVDAWRAQERNGVPRDLLEMLAHRPVRAGAIP